MYYVCTVVMVREANRKNEQKKMNEKKRNWIPNHRIKSFAEGFHLEFICLFGAFSLYFSFCSSFCTIFWFSMLDECTNRDVWLLCLLLFFSWFSANAKLIIIVREWRKSIKNSMCSNLHVNARKYINGFAPSVQYLIWWWQTDDFFYAAHIKQINILII